MRKSSFIYITIAPSIIELQCWSVMSGGFIVKSDSLHIRSYLDRWHFDAVLDISAVSLRLNPDEIGYLVDRNQLFCS